MISKIKILSLFLLSLFGFFSFGQKKDDAVKMNEIQVIGSHNSYKIAIEQPLWEFLYAKDSATAKSLQYTHIPIEAQLDLGLRNLELDVLFDPDGGHYSNPKGLAIIKTLGLKPLEFDAENKLAQPGLKMFHIQDIDYRSHYLVFKEGLQVIKKWSDAHRNHLPIFILINAKDDNNRNLTEPLPFTKEALESIDVEIRSVFDDSQLITPDLVRGEFASLEEAVIKNGWPELDAVRGRFLFILDENETKINRYIDGHPSLKNRVLFVNAKEGTPEAAFRIVNNPIKDFNYIQELVAKGYMVRTRADDGTNEARTNDYTKFEKAKASGAQVISTDYYIPSALFKSTYKVSFDSNQFERIKK